MSLMPTLSPLQRAPPPALLLPQVYRRASWAAVLMLSLLAPLISFTGGGTTGHYGGGVVPLNSAGFSGPLAARIDGSVIDSLQLVEAVANKMALIPGSVFQTYATVMQRMSLDGSTPFPVVDYAVCPEIARRGTILRVKGMAGWRETQKTPIEHVRCTCTDFPGEAPGA